MDKEGIGLLLAAVIAKAVHDRRLAVTHNLIDENCRPLRPLGRGRRDRPEITTGLREFFFCGGLEMYADAAGFDLPIQKIKEISNEPLR